MNLLPGTINLQLTSGALLGGQAVGISGKPYRMFTVALNTLTTGLVHLYNGTSASGTKYLFLNGTTGTGSVVNFADGILFPDGCYLTADIGLRNITIVGTVEPY